MEIIHFPTPRRQGYTVEVFDDRCTPHVLHSFDVTCPSCNHINTVTTGETAIIRRIDIYCGCCKKAITVSNPGVRSKQERRDYK